MKKLHTKLATGIATVVLFGASFAPLASAQYGSEDNGRRSENDFSYRSSNTVSVDQENNANISNYVNANSNTGGNDNNFNRGGSYTHTGNSHVNIGVSNDVNSNYAYVGSSQSHGDLNWNGKSGEYDSDKNKHDDYKDYDKKAHDYSKYMGMKHDSWNKDWDEKKNKDHHKDDHDKKHGDKHDEYQKSSEHHAWMSGDQEVPHKGDPDGKGHTKVTLNTEKNEVCAEIHVAYIQPATAAHIHEGDKGVAGPVVVPLPTPNQDGYAQGCVALDHEKVKQISQNPSHFYVNVHNAEYPDGAVRGQLSM